MRTAKTVSGKCYFRIDRAEFPAAKPFGFNIYNPSPVGRSTYANRALLGFHGLIG
jgi:hypothetical protein